MEPQRLKDKDKEAPPDQGTTNEDSDNQQDGPIPLPWIEAESPNKSQDEATSTPLSPEEGTDAVHGVLREDGSDSVPPLVADDSVNRNISHETSMHDQFIPPARAIYPYSPNTVTYLFKFHGKLFGVVTPNRVPWNYSRLALSGSTPNIFQYKTTIFYYF